VLEHHIQPLRRINSLLLPIHYPDSFYHKALTPDHPISFSRTILWTSTSPSETKVIGGIICRLDPALSPLSTPQTPQFIEGTHDIYIQSLALLSPYRSKGLAAEVLQEIIEAAIGQNEIRIASLYAHVWTENEDALTWYGARGFKREEPVLYGYYRRLNPDTAWVLRRRLMPTDHLLNLASQLPQASRVPQELQFPLASQNPSQGSSAAPSPAIRPENSPSARSFQERGPDREWNDLPEDVFGSALLKPPSHLGSREGSAASSRSSSRSGIEGKGKKKRVYPAAAFGS
jgi:ribosomal protein S18 acetylase RimI-like enzyme